MLIPFYFAIGLGLSFDENSSTMRTYFILIFIIALSLRLSAQQADLVNSKEITSPMHKANIGRIVFTSKYIPLNQLKPSDFPSSYRLTNKSDLFFVFYMDNSLTNYLHRLAPDLSADSLGKTGNFQFNLLVDGHLIYSSNLLPGAPSAAIRDTATVFNKPLIDNGDDDVLWTKSYWGRFMHYGGDSALTEGKHLLRMEIRPYLKLADQTKVGSLIASGDLQMEVNRKPKIDLTTIRLNQVNPYSGYTVTSAKLDWGKYIPDKGKI